MQPLLKGSFDPNGVSTHRLRSTGLESHLAPVPGVTTFKALVTGPVPIAHPHLKGQPPRAITFRFTHQDILLGRAK